MKFDQLEQNQTTLHDLEELRKEIEKLRKNSEKLGDGISTLVDALYNEDGSLRDFSDNQTRSILSEAVKAMKNIPKEIRLNINDSNNLNSIRTEGLPLRLKDEDKIRINELEKDLKRILTYFWWVFWGVAATFFTLGIWSFKVILTSFGQWLSS